MAMALSSPGIPVARQLAFLSAASTTPPNTRRYPLSYVYSGRYSWGDGDLYLQDSYGVWWSTAASSDSNAYLLYMDSNSLLPQHNVNKALGFALHCVSYSTKYPSVSAFVCILGFLRVVQ